MINDQMKAFIKSTFFFELLSETLTPEKEKYLFESLSIISLKVGEFVFRKDDPAHHVFFLLNGLLALESPIPNKSSKQVTKIFPGESIGIYGVFSSTSYPFDAIALRYSQVLCLEKKYFDEHLAQNPTVLHLIIQRLVKTTLLSAKQIYHKNTMTHIALLPAHPNMNLSSFYKSLKHALNAIKPTFFFTADDNQTPENSAYDALKHISNTEQLNVFLLNTKNSVMTHFFLDRSDKIIVIGDGEIEPECCPKMLSILSETHLKKELVLVYRKKTLPCYITHWLNTADYYRFHHLALDEQNDYQRLSRFLQGTATALVLGGGGTRGWVHAGVIKALLENNIPIDAIAGTSIGAFVGGTYFKEEDYELLCQEAMELTQDFKNLFKLSQFTYPITSILTGGKPTKHLKKRLGQHSIESLWKPFFCVSCDLNSSSAFIHRTGPLWQAVRASTSLPGLIPPMVVDGKNLVDGGIINNLPVDLMREFLDETGNIIAVNLSSYQDLNFYISPPEISFWEGLKLHYQKSKKQKVIDLGEIILRASFAGAYSNVQKNAEEADVLINPDLHGFSLLKETSQERVNALIKIGYDEMIQKLPLLKK